MLLSPHTNRERILNYGTMGTGKSHDLIDIMVWSHRTHSPAQFYCIITDNGLIDAIEEGHPELMDRFHPYIVGDYPEYMAAVTEIRTLVAPDDWNVCDLIGDLWDACQREFTNQVFGQSKSNFFLQARLAMEIENERIAAYNANVSKKDQEKEKKKSDTFDGWKDWSVINAMHKEFMDLFAIRNRCHIFAMSQADALGDTEEQQNLDTYQRFGLKPHGQKFIGHNFRTVLLSGRAPGGWVLNTVRDRERRELVAEPKKSFTMSYLKGVAGWNL